MVTTYPVGAPGPWYLDDSLVSLDGYLSHAVLLNGPTVDGAAWYEADGTAH